MTDPHRHEERIVEREVERPVERIVERPVERIVERPARTSRTVIERGTGIGNNPVALILAGVLVVFIVVLVFGYLI